MAIRAKPGTQASAISPRWAKSRPAVAKAAAMLASAKSVSDPVTRASGQAPARSAGAVLGPPQRRHGLLKSGRIGGNGGGGGDGCVQQSLRPKLVNVGKQVCATL